MTKLFVPHISRCPRNCGAYITPDEWDPQQKRCKYCPSRYYDNAESVTEPGVTFGSQKEYRRAKDLQALLVAGKITNLRFHTNYDFTVIGVEVGRYVDDFNYDDLERGIHVVEDTKPPDARKAQDYRRSKKLMKDFYNIEIVEL